MSEANNYDRWLGQQSLEVRQQTEALVRKKGALEAEYAQFAKDQETVNLANDERETRLEVERDALKAELANWRTDAPKRLADQVKRLRDALVALLAVFDDVEILDTPELAWKEPNMASDCQRFRNRIGELEAERDALKAELKWGEPKELSACSRCGGADPHCYICGGRLTIEHAQTENAKLRELAGELMDFHDVESYVDDPVQAIRDFARRVVAKAAALEVKGAK